MEWWGSWRRSCTGCLEPSPSTQQRNSGPILVERPRAVRPDEPQQILIRASRWERQALDVIQGVRVLEPAVNGGRDRPQLPARG